MNKSPYLPNYLPSSCFIAAANCSSELAAKMAFTTCVDILPRCNWSARSSIFLTLSWNTDWKVLVPRLSLIMGFFQNFYYLTDFCWSLACVFFISSSSTITDCFCGSTTPFLGNPLATAVFEKTPRSAFSMSLVVSPFFEATADLRMYCLPWISTSTEPLLR